VIAALERSLAKNPADRFALVSQFADALLQDEPTPPPASLTPGLTPRVLWRVAAIALVVAIALVLAFVLWGRSP
jgi:hypothetical protein